VVLKGDHTYTGATKLHWSYHQLRFEYDDAERTLKGPVSGNGSLYRTGTGTTILEGSIINGGPITINAGTLALKPTTGYTLASEIRGTGALIFKGADGIGGAIALAGNNDSFAGPVRIESGIVYFNNDTKTESLGTKSVTMTGGAIGTLVGMRTVKPPITLSGTIGIGDHMFLRPNNDPRSL
jgi:fibronectin-binding autotransporter adhesin